MKYIKKYELFDWFKKKEPKINYNKITKDPYWRPSEDNAYWKKLFKLRTPDFFNGRNMKDIIKSNKKDKDEWLLIELIMKLTHEKKVTSDSRSEGGTYYFDGIWKTSFDWSKYYSSNVKIEYVTKQEKANEGDKSEEFIFGHGEWFGEIEQRRIVKATEEEIEFYNLHTTTNKYNL